MFVSFALPDGVVCGHLAAKLVTNGAGQKFTFGDLPNLQ